MISLTWAMGNLECAEYSTSLEGMWSYTYDACDIGMVPNQTINNEPTVALTSGYSSSNYELLYLPGQ
ncbi:hypothetical protein F5146DRAFT_938863 [Armillaria mellea]|nr:hypothetical protein F5146DRAFT_938863 [Armillaria mellea]